MMCVFYGGTRHLTQRMHGFSPPHPGSLLFGIYVYVCLSVTFVIHIVLKLKFQTSGGGCFCEVVTVAIPVGFV